MGEGFAEEAELWMPAMLRPVSLQCCFLLTLWAAVPELHGNMD